MYAPKYRYQKRTSAFYQENASLSRSRTKLRSEKSSQRSTTLTRKTSSLGSIPTAVSAGLNASPALGRRRKRATLPTKFGNAGPSEPMSQLEPSTKRIKSRFALRSLSAPSTPGHGGDREGPVAADLVRQAIDERHMQGKAWWESPQSSNGELDDMDTSMEPSPLPGRHAPLRLVSGRLRKTSGDSHQAVSPDDLDLQLTQLCLPPTIRVLSGSDTESRNPTPSSVRSVKAVGFALGATDTTDQERAEISRRQAGGRRRSVTFKLEAETAQPLPRQPIPRPTTLGIGLEGCEAAAPTAPSPSSGARDFLAVCPDQRRGSVSSRSSSASSVYGAPPVKYDYDQRRYSRRSSADEDMAVVDVALPEVHDVQAARSDYGRRKSIDQSFQWHMKEFELQPSNVECFNLSYSIREPTSIGTRLRSGLKRTSTDPEATPTTGRAILKNVTLRIDPGSLVGVLGPSGCGKTTLLNTIAKRYSRKTAAVDGAVLFNRVRSTREWVRHNVGYVAQHDSLLPALTVEETLLYAARLRVPKSLGRQRLMLRIQAILVELGLNRVSDQQVGDGLSIRGLSGGERRRVSIAVQILSAPAVLILDEPTTGLDSFTTTQLVYTLTKLTQQQHVVIMSIHQPRSDLFQIFHDIVLMNDGELVWAGPSQQMLLHFNRMGYSCPLDTNPLQYFVKLASVNSNCSDQEKLTADCVAELKKQYQTTAEYQELVDELKVRGAKRVAKRSITQLGSLLPNEGPPPWLKFQVLTKRAFVNTIRSPSAVFARAFQLPILALYLFLFFTRIGDDQRSLQDRNGLRLETLVEVSLATAVTAMNLCPPLRDMYLRETQEGLYGSSLFLLSYFAHCLPFAAVSSMLWSLAIYVLIGHPLTAAGIFTYFALVLLLHLAGEIMAVLMIGLCRSVPAADSATTFWIMISIAVSSGTYRVGSTLPTWLYGLSLATPFGYAGNIIKINELRGLQLTGCPAQLPVTASWATTTPLNSTATAVGPYPSTTCENGTCTGSPAAVQTSVASPALNGSSWEAACYRTGDEFLSEALAKPWQLDLTTNFCALLGILLAFYAVTFSIFGLRRRLAHS